MVVCEIHNIKKIHYGNGSVGLECFKCLMLKQTEIRLELNLPERKRWYYGTRLNKWYFEYPSVMPEYKRNEGLSDSDFKRLGESKARGIILAPSILISD